MNITIIGAGLAGCEAAWQAANQGANVRIFEQKPHKFSPAHKSKNFAELVCSNSLRADGLANAVGLLKAEMRMLNSLIMEAADATRVPAGGALAVDREEFSKFITDKICSHENIEVVYEEITSIPQDELVIIASGPLTEGSLYEEIVQLTGHKKLHFYDAAAPIVTADSLDMNKVFRASRYGKNGDDYLNCPMNREEYEAFYYALIGAELSPIKDFEECFFEGCLPVEELARRGEQTLLFGPLKPVGLESSDGQTYHAVVQLRQDDVAASLYNMVGFQTHLKFPEQKRVFSMIPGLKDVEFARYGVMHRNTYINSPELLDSNYAMRSFPNIFFAGQITGVEGYLESAASGLTVGIAAVQGNKFKSFPTTTAIGSLARYISTANPSSFQPMNINFGIIDRLPNKIRKKREKNEALSARALEDLRESLKDS